MNNQDEVRDKKKEQKEYYRKWCEKNRVSVAIFKNKYNLKRKLEALTHYSNGTPVCACCGEKKLCFLTLDHVDGGGRKHKKQIRANLYLWVRRMKYPPIFQVLCFNCNCGRSINKGVCPHKLYQSYPNQV